MTRKLKIKFYRDMAGEWRWHIYDGKKQLARSPAMGYKRLASAVKGLNASYPMAPIVIYHNTRDVEMMMWGVPYCTLEVIR